jgi:UDP-N-acetylglucosamine 2-epimerase (non-hydrolysing)
VGTRPNLVTDKLSDLLFTTSREAGANLAAERFVPERVFFVGNTMIDTLEAHLPRALESPIQGSLGLSPREYAVTTLHRPSNVDDQEDMELLVRALGRMSERLPVVFPVHARTRDSLHRFGLAVSLGHHTRLILTEPLGYLDFICLLAQARLVLTDSGGIQEETTVLNVPCLTLRKNTERPITIWEGTNRLVDPEDEDAILAAVDEVLAAPMPAARRPELWDGHAGERIVEVVVGWLGGRAAERGSRY